MSKIDDIVKTLQTGSYHLDSLQRGAVVADLITVLQDPKAKSHLLLIEYIAKAMYEEENDEQAATILWFKKFVKALT